MQVKIYKAMFILVKIFSYVRHMQIFWSWLNFCRDIEDLSLYFTADAFLWITTHFKDVFATYYQYRYVDYIFGNETEAKIFAKVRGWEVVTD